MPLYQPEVLPDPARDMTEVNARIAQWYTEGQLVSAAPELVGSIDNEHALTPLVSTQQFHTAYGAKILLSANGTLVEHIPDGTNTTAVRDTSEIMELLDPILRIINSDARRFAAIPEGAALSASFDLMSGNYLASSETNAHIDPYFGLGYFACVGASTEFIPGYFDMADVGTARRQRDRFPNVVFNSGAIIRADETMLHRAPILERPAPRLLGRFIINDVRKY
jgi:hypothetical protein